jgi:hypothetical protein
LANQAGKRGSGVGEPAHHASIVAPQQPTGNRYRGWSIRSLTLAGENKEAAMRIRAAVIALAMSCGGLVLGGASASADDLVDPTTLVPEPPPA